MKSNVTGYDFQKSSVGRSNIGPIDKVTNDYPKLEHPTIKIVMDTKIIHGGKS